MHAENLREHRKGLLVDLVTDVSVGNDTAWHQVTTFLHQQRTSLSDEPKPPPQKQPKLRPPSTVLRVPDRWHPPPRMFSRSTRSSARMISALWKMPRTATAKVLCWRTRLDPSSLPVRIRPAS